MAEEIGSVKVGIEGDYSQLEKDFQDAIALAVSEGKTLAEAMQAAMPILDGTPVTDALKSVSDTAQKTGSDLQQTGDQTKSFFQQLQGVISNAVSADNAAFESFANGVQNFIQNPLRVAGDVAKDFILTIGPIGGIALAGAAALAVLGKEAFDLVAEFGQAAEATGNLADRLNLTWRETRNLEEMAQIAGISIGGLTRVSMALAEAIDGTSPKAEKLRDKLEKLGVTGRDSGEMMHSLLERLAQIPDATQRIALATEVLGNRGAAQLIPLIKNFDDLKKAVSETGPAISDELAERLKAADDAFDKLSLSITHIKESLAAELAPAVMAIVDSTRELIVETSKLTHEIAAQAAGWASLIPAGLIGGLEDIAKTIISIQVTLNPVIAGLRLMKSGFDEIVLASSIFTGVAPKFATMSAAMTANQQRLDAVKTSSKEFLDVWRTGAGPTATLIQSIIDQQSKLAGNVTTAKAAYDRLNEAFKTGTALADGHRVTSEEVARALANLTAATAAAATTTQGHAEKTKQSTKTLLDMGDALKILVLQIKEEFDGFAKVTAEAAHMNLVFGTSLSTLDVLKIKTADAAEAMRQFDKNIEKTVEDGQVLLSLDGIVKKTGEEMKIFGDQINEANQKALDASGFKELDQAFKDLGITSTYELQQMADKAAEDYRIISDSGEESYEVVRLAALKSLEAQINLQYRYHKISREEWETTTASIKKDIADIDITHQGSITTRGNRERTLAKDLEQINRQLFNRLSSEIATDIVEWKNWGDSLVNIGKDVAKSLIKAFLDIFLVPLENRMAKVLGGIGGGGGGTPSVPGVPGIPGGGGGGGAAGSLGSGFAGIFSMVTGAITAISSVVGNFQMAHMSSDLQKIEESTRYLKIGLVTQSDSLLTTSHDMLDAINKMVIQTYGLVGINLSGSVSQGAANKLLDDLVNSSTNLYVVAARTLTEIRDSIRGGTTLLLGQLHEIAKGANPSILQRLLSGSGLLGGGLGGIGAGIGGGISSLISAFTALPNALAGGVGSLVSAITGGGNADMGKLEENTRYLKIGLVDQGDSLLNDSHIIRNTLTDMMSFNWSVVATQLQNISVSLDALVAAGAYGGGGATASFGGGGATASAAVHIDLRNANLSGDLTDGQVRTAFDRGFRMSKLGGALRPGVFPQ